MTYLPLAARICLALIFLNAGVNHLLGFSGFVSTIASKGLPLPQVLAIGATRIFTVRRCVADFRLQVTDRRTVAHFIFDSNHANFSSVSI